MTEDEVRAIVRDELARAAGEQSVRDIARADQHRAARLERLADEPADGPIVRELKAKMRGDA